LGGLDGPVSAPRLPEVYRTAAALTALRDLQLRHKTVHVPPDAACLSALTNLTLLELKASQMSPELFSSLGALRSLSRLALCVRDEQHEGLIPVMTENREKKREKKRDL
jgi:hypothetical protein